jgi:hypothetical protein
MEDSPTYGTQKQITNCLADSILKKHEDENEYHFHRLDRRFIIEAMEEFALTSEFAKAVHLLSELASLQNGSPLESYREKYEETMKQVEEFLTIYDKPEMDTQN